MLPPLIRRKQSITAHSIRALEQQQQQQHHHLRHLPHQQEPQHKQPHQRQSHKQQEKRPETQQTEHEKLPEGGRRPSPPTTTPMITLPSSTYQTSPITTTIQTSVPSSSASSSSFSSSSSSSTSSTSPPSYDASQPLLPPSNTLLPPTLFPALRFVSPTFRYSLSFVHRVLLLSLISLFAYSGFLILSLSHDSLLLSLSLLLTLTTVLAALSLGTSLIGTGRLGHLIASTLYNTSPLERRHSEHRLYSFFTWTFFFAAALSLLGLYNDISIGHLILTDDMFADIRTTAGIPSILAFLTSNALANLLIPSAIAAYGFYCSTLRERFRNASRITGMGVCSVAHTQRRLVDAESHMDRLSYTYGGAIALIILCSALRFVVTTMILVVQQQQIDIQHFIFSYTSLSAPLRNAFEHIHTPRGGEDPRDVLTVRTLDDDIVDSLSQNGPQGYSWSVYLMYGQMLQPVFIIIFLVNALGSLDNECLFLRKCLIRYYVTHSTLLKNKSLQLEYLLDFTLTSHIHPKVHGHRIDSFTQVKVIVSAIMFFTTMLKYKYRRFI